MTQLIRYPNLTDKQEKEFEPRNNKDGNKNVTTKIIVRKGKQRESKFKKSLKKFLNQRMSLKGSLKKEPRATYVIKSNDDARSAFFESEYEKEKKKLLRWK